MLNRAVIHGEVHLLGGATLFRFTNSGFRPGINLGGGGRIFVNKYVSFRFDMTHNIVLPTGGGTTSFGNVMTVNLGLALNFGERAKTVTRLLASCSRSGRGPRSGAPPPTKPAHPVTENQQAAPTAAPAASDGGVGSIAPTAGTGTGAAPVAAPAPAPKKIDPKLFDDALNDYFAGRPKDAAPKLFDYTENVPSTDVELRRAQSSSRAHSSS